MSYATKEQLAELAAYMASQINVPTIGIGGGYAPIGTIISYMGTTAPQDYLACDGSTKNIADYPQLADFFEAQFGSKNYFGGDGTTTFAVPDLRGEFLRGTGTNSHTNQGSGANVGVHQDGTVHVDVYRDSNTIGVCDNGSGSAAPSNQDWSAGRLYYNPAASSQHSSSATSRGSFTSRPTNTSVLYCIKAVVAGDVYSTDERVVGTWIDGKPLYQKVVRLDFTTSSEALFPITMISEDIDYTDVKSMFGHAIVDPNTRASVSIPCYYSANGTISVYVSSVDNKIHLVLGSQYRNTQNYAYIIFRYTKTTD